jgi:RecA/RadA recombinase
MPKAKVEEIKVDGSKVSKAILSSLIDDAGEEVWNRSEKILTKVSTGSLKLDAEIALTQGIHRFCGPAGAGKTSEAAEVCRNFLNKYQKAKVLWVKAEGRLSDNIQNRSGVKFVTSEDAWEYGTAFILECNTFEIITKFLDALMKAFYENGERLLVIIDSLDGVKLKSDQDNEIGKERTAGVPLMLKRYLQRSYFLVANSGTMIIIISQVSASPRADNTAAPQLTPGAGGNAALHWSNYILEFGSRYWGDNILEDPKAKYEPEKNPIIGHWSTVTIKKSDKENENKRIKYPIKHGRADGRSVWVEDEIIEFAEAWGLLIVSGSWFSFPAEVIKDVKDKLKVDLEPKLQGKNKIIKYFEENPKITQYLFERIKTVVAK